MQLNNKSMLLFSTIECRSPCSSLLSSLQLDYRHLQLCNVHDDSTSIFFIILKQFSEKRDTDTMTPLVSHCNHINIHTNTYSNIHTMYLQIFAINTHEHDTIGFDHFISSSILIVTQRKKKSGNLELDQ